MLMPPILLGTEDFVVLNKPAGIPVHPGPSRGPSIEDLFPQLSRRRTGPWLAHRLDADTAGCLVIALKRAALHAAQAEFAAGRAEKTYWAIVQGGPRADAGTIDLPLTKTTTRHGWRMQGTAQGLPAVTDWRVLARGPTQTWLELHPHTGRTHQIRVHCASLGCPLLGDPIYGEAAGDTQPLQLLARTIRLRLTPEICATAPPPPHMQPLLEALRPLPEALGKDAHRP